MKTDRSWSELAETFHRDGVLWFSSGLAMDVRKPIEWPRPFPQVSRMRIARDLFYFMESAQAAGLGFRPLGSVPSTELAAREALVQDALTKFAIGAVEELPPGMQTDWTFGAILIATTQFLAKVEADLRLVMGRAETPERGTPSPVLDLLGGFIALDRDELEIEARRLDSLAAQGNQPSPSIQ